MTGLTTTQAAAMLGIAPNSFRGKATRARAKGQEWRLPREQWPDGRTPLYDPDAIRATRDMQEREPTMTANIAFAPISGPNSIYDTPGIDLLDDSNSTTGEAEHVQWIEHTGSGEFDQVTAEQMLRDAGYAVEGGWDTTTTDDYAIARIAPQGRQA